MLMKGKSEGEVIEEIKATWLDKINKSYEWKAYIRTLIKLPDSLNSVSLKLSQNFYKVLCDLSLSLDLEDPYYFAIALYTLNSLLLLRKPDPILSSLQSFLPFSPSLASLTSQLSPLSVYLYKLFSFPSPTILSILIPTPAALDFFSLQLPFKLRTSSEAIKLSSLLLSFKIVHKALESVSKAWSDSLFLSNSLHINTRKNHIALTVLIHQLIHKDLPVSITSHIFPGIQMRLSSSIINVAQSGLLIASRVAEVMNSEAIVKFTLDDFLAGKTAEDIDSDEEAEDEEVVVKKVGYLQELLQGLRSSNRERYVNSINSAPELIKQDLSDLDLVLTDLAEILIKAENSFNINGFEELRFKSIVNLACLRPVEMCGVFVERLKENCTISSKLMVLDVVREVSRKLANPEEKEEIVKNDGKKSKYYEIHERLKKKTKRFFMERKKPQGSRPNYFFQHFERYCSGVLGVIGKDLHHLVLSKAIYTLSELLEHVGASCDYNIATQCVYIIRYVVKEYLKSEKREIVQSTLILMMCVAQKLEGSGFLKDFESLVKDLSEISQIIEGMTGDLQELATKSLLALLSIQMQLN